MTHRQRMLAALTGQGSDRLPWVPRLDLWYRANKLAGTLPEAYAGATLAELAAGMDIGLHAVIPDFRDLTGPEDDADRALGIYNLDCMPYRTELQDVQRRITVDGDRTLVEYHTPLGDLRTVVLYDEAMRRSGISITHIQEHVIKGPEDFAALSFIFENAAVRPNYEGYRRFAANIGEQGLAVGFVSLAASPMHLMQRELMPLDSFFLAMYDYPEGMARLAESIGSYWRRVMETVVDSPAEVLLVGANYDAAVTHPPFFKEHIMPWLQLYSRELHCRNKYLLTHTDGENSGLLDHYLEAGIDIADSICPKPMTRLSFKEVRDAFDGRISIMGGIPSIALMPFSMPDGDFDAFIDEFFAQIDRGEHLILGISDTTPPQADFKRLIRIGRMVEAFGPVPANYCQPDPASAENSY